MNTYKQQMKGGMDALMNVNDGLFDVFLCYYFVKRFGNINCSQVRSTYVLTVKVNDRGWKSFDNVHLFLYHYLIPS